MSRNIGSYKGEEVATFQHVSEMPTGRQGGLAQPSLLSRYRSYMEENSLDLLHVGGPVRSRRRIPNSIIFPKELREAIPTHSARALQFDRVSASMNATLAWACLTNLDWLKASGYDTSVSRVRLSFLAHETGNLQGQYEIGLDLDAETLRAVGEFFVTLADRADSSRES